MTIEEDYERDVREVRRLYPRKSAARRAAFRALQERHEARLFKRDGRLDVVYRAQSRFAERYVKLIRSFYLGEIDDETYLRGRRKALLGYAERLFAAGLLTAVFEPGWLRDFLRSSLQFERSLLPVRPVRDSFTEEERLAVCGPLIEHSKIFFLALHSEFGVMRLKNHPAIFGGVDPVVAEAEIVASASQT